MGGEPRHSVVELRSSGYELPCELWEPPSVAKPEVALVLCHGATQKGMRHELIRHLASRLSYRWPVLAFDLPGFGRAPRLVIRGPDDYLYYAHALAAAERAEELTGLKAVLVGHSMGGRVSLQAAARGGGDLVAGVITIAGLYDFPSSPSEMLRLVEDFVSFVRVKLEVPVEELARDIAERRVMEKTIRALRVPLLAVEAGREHYAFIRNSRYGLFKAARCPKTLVLLGKADHKFKEHHEAVANVIADWLEHYLGSPAIWPRGKTRGNADRRLA